MIKIFGLGTDVVNLKRFKSIISKNNSFKRRIFSKSEIKYCEKKKNNASFYAKRFAAKEAFSKALGTGIAKGLSFNEIVVENNYLGKPDLYIKGKSLKTVYKIIKKKKFKTFLSMSDDEPFISATVLIVI
ncbi:MAG: holo-[acyl-carrier protein] synthase [Pelagibacterales bacterium]|nr:holo-[acyl-carrier protein] synthase [Pelagibacterales bacterium]